MLKKSCCKTEGIGSEALKLRMNPLRVALIGNPNTGKTTLFNTLTGLRQHVANYPGITVEKRWGIAEHVGGRFEVLDLPGVRSLQPRSADERVVHDVLYGEQKGTRRPEVIVAIADPFHLEKNLYLISQLRALKVPLVVAINYMDEARRRRLDIDMRKLEKRLGVRVLGISALKHEGLQALGQAVLDASGDGKAPGAADVGTDPAAVYAWAAKVVEGVFSEGRPRRAWTDKLDAVLLHPIAGPVILAGIMFVIFQSIFTWAIGPMEAILNACDGLGAWVRDLLPIAILAEFLSDGLITGVGAVLAFVPQIFLLFLFIGILEDTGYLARAAFLLDRLLSKVGLNGKAFLPLFSCFACAVPGIMATRVIENRRERLATILVAPLMSCSARIPIYALVTAALIPPAMLLGVFNLQGVVFFAMYVLGIVAAALMAWIFKRGLVKTKELSHFFMELPPYHVPHWKTLLIHVWERTSVFIKNAGTIILMLSMVVWVLSAFPRSEATGRAETAGSALEHSFIGRAGKVIEPVLQPLGFDWKIGIGILASFAQREVFVSTLAIIYNVGAEEEGQTVGLGRRLREEKDPRTGKPVYPPLVGISILIFYALACQCMSTLAIVRRETGTWSWAFFMFAYMTALAYLCSLAVYQGGRMLGIGLG